MTFPENRECREDGDSGKVGERRVTGHRWFSGRQVSGVSGNDRYFSQSVFCFRFLPNAPKLDRKGREETPNVRKRSALFATSATPATFADFLRALRLNSFPLQRQMAGLFLYAGPLFAPEIT
jgi:hypothetical protein